jgi:hypothetical protein
MASVSAMTVEHIDRYTTPSSVRSDGIFLAASSSGASAAPFFSGCLVVPHRGADLALTIAEVVRTRYYTPPGMVQRLIQQSDPVITCGGGMLRFEGFSACCGVYARLDLPDSAFDADRLEPGTANVDFNPPMRAALSKLVESAPARLTVSKAGFAVTAESGGAFERRVALPIRWMKGFLEVQGHQARMERRFAVSGDMAKRFLRELPRQKTAGVIYVSPRNQTLRLSQAGSGSVAVGGVERLRILANVARHAVELEVYSSGDGATAWRLETPDSRLFVVLSPEPSRGFSGEGQALHALARAMLRWQSTLDADVLAAELGSPKEQIAAALAELGASGLVGFDLAQAKYFHRELPFDLARVRKLHPRLAAAREIASGGHTEIESDGAGAWVRGKDGEYRVRRDRDGQWHCLCPWHARHGGSRGPCKHILAAQIAAGEAMDEV